jgi:uncharacterized protein (TIGR03437 family)
LLPSGKVLIAGGWTNVDETTASAELYDPATGTFTATGPMTVARSGHAALLNTGKVLIAGGGAWQDANAAASADLYDPATGTFTATGNMHEPSCDSATLLPNGKVLITRSVIPGTGTEVRHAELYDPSAGTFAFTADTVFYHNGPTGTLLLNGKVLIAGGDIGNGDGNSDAAELYDPATGTFAFTGNLTSGREQDAATLLPDGTVLFAGGHGFVPVPGGGSDNLASAETYNPATGAFTAAGAMITGRDLLLATLLNNGKVLITGGNEYYPVGAGGRVPLQAGVPIAELYTPAELVPPPVLLSMSGDGQGQGAIQHAGTTRIASADDPAVAGEYLSIYLNGLADGSVIPPQVAIGGRAAEVTFFGDVPGYPGQNVVNIRMPGGVAPGPAVPVRLTYLGRSSNQVTIGVALDAALQQAVTAMKTASGTDSLNFWQWAWYWQYLLPFNGAPAGFGVIGSISPDVMEQIIIAGGGDPLQNISAEQWLLYLRSATTHVSGVVNAASLLGGAIAPGELVILTGSGLGPAQVVSAAPDSDGAYAAQLAGTVVLVNGVPVPLVYTSASQVEALVPDSIAGGTAQFTVVYQGLTSASFPVPVAPTAPGIFTQNATGQGYAVTINQKGAMNIPAHWEGDVMTLFLTGAGHATSTNYGGGQLPITQGPTPGVMQIKLPISRGTDCDFPVIFQVGNATTQPGVTIAVDLCI